MSASDQPIVHTPGPWDVKVYDDGAYIIADGPVDDLSSCIIASRNAHPEPTTGKANARLIAAAPELLKACELVSAWMIGKCAGPYSDSMLLEVVDNAIRKATN